MLLMEAVAKRKITIEPSGAYRYGNMFLGMTEESALDWLNNPENKSVTRLLEEDVNPQYFKEEVIEEVEEYVNTNFIVPSQEFVRIEPIEEISTPIIKPVAKKPIPAKKIIKK
jgi:hypothetical protein